MVIGIPKIIWKIDLKKASSTQNSLLLPNTFLKPTGSDDKDWMIVSENDQYCISFFWNEQNC